MLALCNNNITICEISEPGVKAKHTWRIGTIKLTVLPVQSKIQQKSFPWERRSLELWPVFCSKLSWPGPLYSYCWLWCRLFPTNLSCSAHVELAQSFDQWASVHTCDKPIINRVKGKILVIIKHTIIVSCMHACASATNLTNDMVGMNFKCVDHDDAVVTLLQCKKWT